MNKTQKAKNKLITNDVIHFVLANGWKIEKEHIDSEYYHFYKSNNIGIDISKSYNDIVLIGDIGDFKNFEINVDIKYTLIGYFLSHRYIAIDCIV